MGDDGRWIRSKLPETDLVVYDTAEERILDLLDRSRWSEVPRTDRSLITGPPERWGGNVNLRYELIGKFKSFHPSIEVSRGCGMGCNFCVERNAPLQKLRCPQDVVEAMERASDLFQEPALNFYLEASWFTPNGPWAEMFARQYVRNGLRSRWRCETRVDTLQLTTLPDLVRGGLKVVDLGLESASTQQLQSMNKTRDPVRYLGKASQLLHQCRELGVWVKLNVMLYPGETAETVSETLDWMHKHQDCIKGVSVSAMTVYGHGADTQRYLTELGAMGARPVDADSIERDGYTYLHLSRRIDFDQALTLGSEIAQAFMSDRDYYDLKSFSYFPRGYTYAEFCSNLERETPENLPFRIEAKSPSAASGTKNSAISSSCSVAGPNGPLRAS